MAPPAAKSLSRLSKDSIIDLALEWLSDKSAPAPYLLRNRTGFEADEEDYEYTPAASVRELRQLYNDLRHDSKRTKRDIVDRIVDGDWRRGLSLHQYATIDFAHLQHNDKALRWSALKLVPLQPSSLQGEKNFEDEALPKSKKRKLAHDPAPIYPQVSPEAFPSSLKAEISPLVKAHYQLHRLPTPYDLTILRVYISPNSAFAPKRAKIPQRAKHATDSGRIIYIALPDSCPYVYVSVSGSSGPASTRSKSGRDAKEKVLSKVDVAAVKRIVLEAIPKALSRPQQRWALEATKLVAKSLRTMCELRGNQKPGTGGGGYSRFAVDDANAEHAPVDVQMAEPEAMEDDSRQKQVDERFGSMTGQHYAAIDKLHVKMCNVVPTTTPSGNDDSTLSEDQPSNDIYLTFSGTDVFAGLKKLAQLDGAYIDLDKMPAWMTGELGVSTLAV